MKRSDFKVDVANGILTISSKKKKERMKMMRFHHHEKEDGCMVHINCYGGMEKSCKYIDFCKIDTEKGNK
ncbi:MAG TPA: hypothetical protein VKG26_13020 [Bacteroidia bacterium]|nr:hypothetical protein [Bacteroidia bacterium]